MSARAWWIATTVVIAAGCPGDGGGDPDGALVTDASPSADGAADADPGPRRPYRLASTGAQLSPATGLTLGAANLATDVDVIAIHQDFYGVPWDAFRDQVEPPAAWVAAIDAIADQAQATGKPIFLSLSPTDGGNRRRIAPRVVVTGTGYTTESDWKPECYDLGTAPDGDDLQDAFSRYTTWMVERFAPRWVNVGIELNLFMPCGAAWEGMVDLERDAYLAAKAAAPGALVFPSIQIDHLYGRAGGSCEPPRTPDQCYAENYPRLQRLQRDRFAISTYPYLQEGITTPSTIPGNWFTRAADEGGEQLLIAETGWLATSAAGTLDDACITPIVHDPTEQADYFDLLIDLANDESIELVTWWSNRDVVVEQVMTDCPCDFDAQWCAIVDLFRMIGGDDPVAQFYGEMLLKIFGTMGIRDHDGTPRQPIFDRWTAARELPPAD